MRAMKDSGIEWIGEIPESWDAIATKQLFSIVSGATPKSENLHFYDGDIIWITPADYKTEDVFVSEGRRNITKEGLNSCNTSIIPVGSIIFSKRAPIGSVAINSVELCTNQGCLSCIPQAKVDTKYYYYSMSIYTEQYNLLGSGTTFKEISATCFSDFKLPTPSFTEQQAISAYLDRQCALIDSITEKTKATIEEYKKLRQAVITQAVTKGVRGDRPMKDSGIEWIGEIPESWEIYRIASLYLERKEQGNDELPILTVSINTGVSDRELADDETARVFVRSEDKSKYMKVCPGDLTYNMMRAWQGAFGAVRVEGMVSPAYVIAKPKRDIDSRYMEALLRTPAAKEEMKRYSHGITDFRLRLYWEKFKCIKICFPSVEEQREIADYIDKKCAEIDSIIAKKEQFLTELETYKKSMIYEYVTGKKEVPQA